MITVGIDESGVGTLAGPLIVVAAAFNENTRFSRGIKDSKKLNDAQREGLIDEIYDQAEWIIIKRVSAAYINTCKNIWAAWDVAMTELLGACLKRKPDLIIVDGSREIAGVPNISYEIKGDVRFVQVSAASIVAKYIQTLSMLGLHEEYLKFGFDQHKGYPTAQHLRRLASEGPTKFHRFAYRPVKAVLEALSPQRRMEITQLDLSTQIKTFIIEGL